MWTSVIDTKQGKVWANLPSDPNLMLVADVEEDADKYWEWNKIIRAIREADESKIEVFGKLIEKKFEETIDENIKPSYTINSDRGNPSDL
jgi:hypothetical protein